MASHRECQPLSKFCHLPRLRIVCRGTYEAVTDLGMARGAATATETWLRQRLQEASMSPASTVDLIMENYRQKKSNHELSGAEVPVTARVSLKWG